MKFYSISLVFLSLSFLTQAQISPNVEYGDDNQSPKSLSPNSLPGKGVYQDFKEFQSQQPSGSQTFTLDSQNGRVLRFLIRDQASNKKIKKAYGFSDGQSQYISARQYGNGNYYVRVETQGRYAFFRDEGGSGGLGIGIGFGPVAVGTGNGNVIQSYILDRKNGVIEPLRPKLMKAILTSEPQLLRAYEEEKVKRDPNTLLKYITQYNAARPLWNED